MLVFLANQVAEPGNTNRDVGRVIFPALASGYVFHGAPNWLHAFPRLPLVSGFPALTIGFMFSRACHPLLVVTVAATIEIAFVATLVEFHDWSCKLLYLLTLSAMFRSIFIQERMNCLKKSVVLCGFIFLLGWELKVVTSYDKILGQLSGDALCRRLELKLCFSSLFLYS